MSKPTPFRYSGYWDVPLGLVVQHKGTSFFLERTYDEDLDDYSHRYSVYLIPNSMGLGKGPIPNSFWNDLRESGLKCLGQLPVALAKFDRTKRKSMDTSALDKFISK